MRNKVSQEFHSLLTLHCISNRSIFFAFFFFLLSVVEQQNKTQNGKQNNT